MPTVTHERVNLASMVVNLAVMDVVGRQEAPVFTWNPVEQMWIQERGGAAKAPPSPHDVHAIQTWFLDADEAEWIQTVLGPMGRQLAAQWRGAYRVPDAAIARQSKSSKSKSKDRKGSPLPILLAVLVLIALIGGVAAATSLRPSPTQSPAATQPGSVAESRPPAPAPSAEEPAPSATAAPTPAPTEAPATQAPPPPRVTPRPATAVPRPAGISVTFGNGTTVVYTGPLSVNRGANLPGTFTVILANGRPASGVFTIMLGDLSQPLRTVEGSLDPARGTIAMGVPATLPAGNWPLYFKFEGAIVQIATIAVR